MRPIRLILRAFGPYAGEQIFDFRELGNRSFFLIHGPTGSGKTTLLDAMCFALYGDTSGDERQGKQMRSDHADPAFPTEVAFDFSLGSESYRVTRSPEQERPRQRGSGMTTDRPKATLWRQTGIADDEKEGSVLASQWNETTKTIEDLLGFRSDQFRQVVLLPQGQFRRLLLAKSAEREEILERLFRTELYRRIGERLKERAKKIHDGMKDALRRRDLIAEQGGVGEAAELEPRLKALSTQLDAIREKVSSVRKLESESLKVLQRGRETAGKFQEASNAQEALKRLESRIDFFKGVESRLQKARRASTLVDGERHFQKAKEEAAEATHAVAAAETTLKNAAETKAAADQTLDSQRKREPELEAAKATLTQLEGLVEKAKGLDRAREERIAADRLHGESEQHLTNARTLLETLQDELRSIRESLETARKGASRFEALEATCREWESRLSRRRDFEAVHTECDKAAEQMAAHQKTLDEAEATVQKARHDLAELETAWTEGQAAILSEHLRPGEPCPVCGSTEHPHPARSETPLPTEQVLREARTRIETLEMERDRIREKKTEAERHRAGLESKRETLRVDLGDLATVEVSGVQEKFSDAKKALEEARALRESVLSLEKGRSGLEEREKQGRDAIVGLEEKRRESETRMARARADVELREEEIPESLREPGALDRKRRETADRVTTLVRSMDTARESAARAAEELARHTEGLRGAKDRAKRLSEALEASRRSLETRLREAGFAAADGPPDRGAFEIARRDIESIPKLESDLKVFDGDLESARDRVRRAAESIRDVTMPDVNSLEEDHRSKRETLEAEIANEASVGEQVRLHEKWVSEYKKIVNAMRDLDTEFAVVGRLSEVVIGQNGLGVSFQRYVLASLLDDVLVAASRRLTLMSRGRYILQRSTERATRRSPGGLDLEVFDGYTGVPRPVETLSGGESFLASLSLALGLADVVQAYSGGVYLDTIFVDEGFGSLDPESLDLALRALMDLQKGGRLVGIISHVPELRDRVDVRLEILPDRRGSRARFVVA